MLEIGHSYNKMKDGFFVNNLTKKENLKVKGTVSCNDN